MSKELNVFKTPPDANKIGVLRRKRKVKVLEEDEYVEITPKAIRLRKIVLNQKQRKK